VITRRRLIASALAAPAIIRPASANLLMMPAAGGGSSTNFITGETLGVLNNNVTDLLGFIMTTGATPITITDLGRWKISGNSLTHTIYIIDIGSAGMTNPGTSLGSAVVNLSGGTIGAFNYTTLGSPVTLAGSHQYLVVSSETASGDQWYDQTTVVTTTTVASITQSAIISGSSPTGTWTTTSIANTDYGPCDFKYHL
jgi:hypothetical protein